MNFGEMASRTHKEGICFYLLTLLGAWAASTQTGRKTECPSCGVQDKDAMMEMAKQQILQKLHLKERPNITHPIPRAAVVNALRRLHLTKPRMDGLFGSPSWDSNTENYETEQQSYEIISFAETENRNKSSTTFTFQFTKDNEQNVHVLQAHLWVYFKSNRTHQANQNIKLYMVQHSEGSRVLLHEKYLEPRWTGWQTFSLKQMLQTFFDDGNKNLQLELDCEGCENMPVIVNTNDSYQPFLVAQAKVRERSHHASKRSLKCDQNSNLCCRKDYYVEFKDIGWNDWIIQPEGYQINYCMGLCPMHVAGAPGMAASFQTTVFNLIKANNIHTAVSSCCVPTKRRPLSMLYFDRNNNIVKTDIPDMIVEACGCS